MSFYCDIERLADPPRSIGDAFSLRRNEKAKELASEAKKTDSDIPKPVSKSRSGASLDRAPLA